MSADAALEAAPRGTRMVSDSNAARYRLRSRVIVSRIMQGVLTGDDAAVAGKPRWLELSCIPRSRGL